MDLLRQFHGTVTLPETANALATLPFSHARNIASVLQEKSQQVPPDLSWDDLDQGQVNGILANQSNSLVIQAYNYCTDLQKAALQQADPHTIIPTNQLEILRNAYKTLCEYRTLHPEWDSTYRKIITQLEGMVAQSQKVYDQLYEPEYGLPRHLVQDPLWKALTPDEKKLICSDREKFVNVQARFIDRLDAKNKLATSLNLSHDLAQALNDVLYEIIGEEEQMGQIEKALSFCNSIPYVGTVKTENLFFDEYGISKLASPHAISGLQPIEIKDAEYIALVNNLVLCKQKAETLLDPQARHICLNSVDQAIRYLNTSAIQKTGFRFAQEVSNELTQLFNSKVAIFSELQNNQILTAGNFCEALPTAQQANLQQSVNRLLDRGLTLFSEVGADQQTKSAFVGFLNTVRELNKNNETEKALSILSAIDGLFGNISTQNPEAFGMVYHSNGINKIVTDNSMALAMPQSLGAPENVQARNLVNACLVMLETKAGDQEAIRNCLSWTLVGLHNPKLQGSYSVCAHFLFDSYSQSLESSLKNSAQAMLRCPDLSAALTSPDQIKAQADMTDLLAQGISKYSQPGAPQSADAELTSLIKVISTAQLDNLNGNTQKAVAAIASYQAEFKIEPRIQMTHDSIGAVQACEITTPEQQAAGKASSKPQSIPGQSSITSGSQIQNTPYALQEITDPESAAAETQEEAPAQGKAKPEAEKDKQTVPKAEPILQPKPKAEGKADGTPDAVNTNNGTITPQGPEDDIERKVNPKLKEMSDSELLRSKRSVERQLKEHQEKLKVYQENPDANDNQNFLKNAPSEIIRDQVIATRIRNLTGEIEKFAREINDIVQELIKRGIDG
jgi:hypothetical protein